MEAGNAFNVSIPPQEAVFSNEMLLGIILSKINSKNIDGNLSFIKSLRLVHPSWNDALLSSIVPRFWVRLPLWVRETLYDPNGQLINNTEVKHFPLHTVKGIDPRLVRELEFLENEVHSEGSYPGVSGAGMIQLTALCVQFSDSIQVLKLEINECRTLHSAALLLFHFLPNLKELDMEISDHSPWTQPICRPNVVSIFVRTLTLAWISPENEDKLRLSCATFPNLTRLQFTLTNFNRDPDVRGGLWTNYSRKWQAFFISALNNVAAIEMLRDVRINLSSKMEISHVIDGLAESRIFQAKSIRKLELVFERNVLVDTVYVSSESEHRYAVSLGETLSRTKHMEKVEFDNFVLPPTVLIPVMRTVDRLNLPVSFGNMEATDRVLGRISV